MNRPDLQPVTSAPPPRQATAREFLAVLFRRKWIVLGLFLVTTATVSALTLLQRTEYLSIGKVLVKRGEQESVMTPYRRSVGMWEEELGSEVQTVKSFRIAQRAQELLHEAAASGAPAPVVELQRVDAEVVGKTNVLQIGYTAPEPMVARQVCDAVVRAYLEFRGSGMSLTYPAGFFESQLNGVQVQLDSLMEQRRMFANRERIIDIDSQQQQLIFQLGQLRQKRAEDAADLAEAESELQASTELRDQSTVDLPAITRYTVNEATLIEIKRRIVEQQARIATLRERFREDSPDILAAQRTVDSLRAMLRQEVDSRIALSGTRVRMLRARVAEFDRSIESLERQVTSMPDKESALAEMDRQIELLKTRLKDLTEKSDQARVTEQTSQSTNVILLEPAGEARANRTVDWIRLALAPAFSLVVGIGLAFFIDGLDLTVHNAGHAEEALDMPVLASISERRTGTR